MGGRLVRRGSMLVCAAVASVVALSGCSTNETAAPNSTPNADEETTTVFTTTTITEDDGAVADSGSQETPSEQEPNQASKSAEEISTEAQQIATEQVPIDGLGEWTVADTLYDPTGELSGVVLTTTEGKMHNQVAFFHNDQFVGFALDRVEYIPGWQRTDEGIELEFSDTEAFLASGEPLANAGNFTKSVTFYWDGSQLAHKGEIPA